MLDPQQLSKFVGTWLMEGRTFVGPFTRDAGVHGSETFEWLPDKRVLVHQLEGTLGQSPMACIDITRPDGKNCAVYNDGEQREYDVRANPDGTWTYANAIETNGVTYQNRCTVRFLDERTREATWECSRDGVLWATYWKNVATRVD